LYWDDGRKDYATVVTQESIGAQKAWNYQFVRIEGYVLNRKSTASIPIYLFWNGTKDNATGTDAMQVRFDTDGFKRIRPEGWILKPK
jgi:hypothetical protein